MVWKSSISAFQLDFPARPAEEGKQIDPLFIMTRAELGRDSDRNRHPVRAAALLLAREQLGPSATATQVAKKAARYIQMRKRWKRRRRERSSDISNRNGADQNALLAPPSLP